MVTCSKNGSEDGKVKVGVENATEVLESNIVDVTVEAETTDVVLTTVYNTVTDFIYVVTIYDSLDEELSLDIAVA